MILSHVLIASLLLTPTTPIEDRPVDESSHQSIARFDNSYINLRDGWGEAQACFSDGERTDCFRSEQELDEFLNKSNGTSERSEDDVSVLATCSTTLRLYTGTSFTTPVLALSARLVVHNLSAFSFSNVTSSYKVGACASTFYDGANGGAPTYPGNTSANVQATSMLAGWDNRVSSVYIS